MIYPRRNVIITMKICFIPNSNHHTTNLHQTNYVIFFLKLRVLLLTDVRNVQCYFQLLIYVSYHVCLWFQILLVTILNLCYFSGSHQTAISSIKETYLLNYTIWLFKTIFCVSIEIKCFPTCTKHLITWKLKTLTNLEVLKY